VRALDAAGSVARWQLDDDAARRAARAEDEGSNTGKGEETKLGTHAAERTPAIDDVRRTSGEPIEGGRVYMGGIGNPPHALSATTQMAARAAIRSLVRMAACTTQRTRSVAPRPR
jgi:hypothetical protein